MAVAYYEARRQWERGYLNALLDQCHGSPTRAAEIAGVSRTHFYRMRNRAGIASTADARRRPRVS